MRLYDRSTSFLHRVASTSFCASSLACDQRCAAETRGVWPEPVSTAWPRLPKIPSTSFSFLFRSWRTAILTRCCLVSTARGPISNVTRSCLPSSIRLRVSGAGTALGPTSNETRCRLPCSRFSITSRRLRLRSRLRVSGAGGDSSREVLSCLAITGGGSSREVVKRQGSARGTAPPASSSISSMLTSSAGSKASTKVS